MFTGLVEAIGEIAEVKPTPGGVRLRVATELSPDLSNGDSLAVDGVCLTIVSADAGGVYADVSPVTARLTTLGRVERGTRVNLERPLRADARLGGHFVQGHVDATGTVDDLRREGDSYWLTVKFPGSLAPYIVRKGSIAVGGVSLTVAGVDDRRFDVQIVPYTWSATTFHLRRSGDSVNLECDILGKYVARMMELTGVARLPGQ